ncbi:transcriptional regulator, AraC family [Kribbella flavida DSM 17836]|uniref:Transcriptional regulator, AraC family n=1 Tax=Kribbella flavida (strain DSM 17836 / JCM 10339 / NBRC 14399) TaxID=479435 RepID=D2PUX8_KRIFD|nr:AraC family transcriptional regulator [Kribbella flavida]ADB31444.1 transcriptional regulator, AraC family [Kribbella flavida DSM 17836]
MSLGSVVTADRFVDLAGLLESCEVDGFRADFVSWGHYRPEYWLNYRHSHSFHEVCLAYAGEGRFTSGDTEYAVGPGTVFLARPGDAHEIESSRADPLGIAFWGFTFRPVTRGPMGAGWWSGLTRTDGPVVSARTGGLAATVGGMAAEAAAPQSGYQASLAALGATLVLDTARAFAFDEDLSVEPTARSQARDAVVVDAMQRLLLDNLARPITVREVAAAVHLSERHAERLFRSVTGSSLMSTLRRLRLELAAQLLLDPSTTITSVAHACGYSDVRPFSTAFRRRYGRTPGEYRRTGGTTFAGR